MAHGMDLDPAPRIDSELLQRSFQRQLGNNKEDFLLGGQELTLDHVNRLSTDPEPEYAHRQDSRPRYSPQVGHHDDLLAMDTEDEENWLVASPGPSTTSLGNRTGSHTPQSQMNAEDSGYSWDSAPSKRRRSSSTSQQSFPAQQSNASSAPASTQAPWRPAGPYATGSRSDLSQGPPTASLRNAGTRRQPSGDADGFSTPRSAHPSSRIPKPSPSYTSPSKSSTCSPSLRDQAPATRLRQPSGSLSAPATPPPTTVRTPFQTHTPSASPPGQLRPAAYPSAKFRELWGGNGSAKAASCEDYTSPLRAQNGATGSAESPGWPNLPSRIPKVTPQKPTQPPTPEQDTVTHPLASPPLPLSSNGHTANHQPPPDGDDSDNSDIIVSHVDDRFHPASRSARPSQTGHESYDQLDMSASGARPVATQESGFGGPESLATSSSTPSSTREPRAELYVPQSQRNKEPVSPAVELLMRPDESQVQPGAFTKVMELDGYSPKKPLPPSPFTDARLSQEQDQQRQQSQATAQPSASEVAPSPGVGTYKAAGSGVPNLPAKGGKGPKKQSGCCGCSIM